MLRLAALLALTATVEPRAQAVAWAKGDFAVTLKAAKAAKRKLFVDVFASWCGPCHAMDAKVYPRPDVTGALARSYVALRVDAEAGEGVELAKRYRVVGFPTLLFLDADGNEIDRIFGEVPAEELVRTANGFAKGEGTFASAERAWFDGQLFDAKAAAELSKRASAKGDLERARFFRDEVERIAQAFAEVPHTNDARLADVVARTDKASMARVQTSFLKEGLQKEREGANRGRIAALKALRDAELWYAKYGLLRGAKDYAAAAAELQGLVVRHAGTDEGDQAQLQLAYALDGQGDKAGAKKALDEYLSNHAKDKEASAANAYAWFCFRQGAFVEEGMAVAQKALAAFPKEDGLWDTLAELQSKAGDAAGAAASEKKAMALKPADAYYKAQLKKFSSKK